MRLATLIHFSKSKEIQKFNISKLRILYPSKLRYNQVGNRMTCVFHSTYIYLTRNDQASQFVMSKRSQQRSLNCNIVRKIGHLVEIVFRQIPSHTLARVSYLSCNLCLLRILARLQDAKWYHRSSNYVCYCKNCRLDLKKQFQQKSPINLLFAFAFTRKLVVSRFHGKVLVFF